MADDRAEPHEINFRQWLPWTQIFRGFWIALDHKKLLLAAAGILAMSLGWWLISSIAYKATKRVPQWSSGDYQQWDEFTNARKRWNLFYQTAGPGDDINVLYDENDLAQDKEEYERLVGARTREATNLAKDPDSVPRDELAKETLIRERAWRALLPADVYARLQLTGFRKAAGELRTLPWFEDRGRNQFLLVTGHADPRREGRSLVDWLVTEQVPVLIEPLVKLLRPVKFFLYPDAGFGNKFYFLIVMIWTVAVWAIFGGAITRIAAVEIARNEKIGLGEAVRYTVSRWKSYIFASFFPLLIIAFIVVLLGLFGALNWIPIFREFWDGLLFFLLLLGGLAIAVLLVGLVGWPMIHVTLSAEGSDSFDALSRSYSYVLQKPWSYLWYAAVALVYGAVVVFFVGLMGSLTVYLAKLGESQFTVTNHWSDPSYMFVWAPTSYHWRDLLLQGSQAADSTGVVREELISNWERNFSGWNYIGSFLVTAWLYLVFLLIIGFAYSYFWSASTMIYLLMRRKVDDTEMDEVYLEEEDSDEPYSTTAPSTAPAPAAGGTTPIQLIEPPTLRQPVPSATTPPSGPAEGSVSKPGDGEASPGAGVVP